MRSRAVAEALLLEALGFTFVAVLIWVNEYLDLPHLLFGAPVTPWRPVEVAIESGFVCLLGAAVTALSWLTFRRLAYLESLLTLCASCQRVSDDGRWLPFEQFIATRDRMDTTHGVCPECCERTVSQQLARVAGGGR